MNKSTSYPTITVDLRKLSLDEFQDLNPIYDRNRQAIRASIEAHGIRDRILVWDRGDGQHELVDGFTRRREAIDLGVTEAEAEVLPASMTKAEARRVARQRQFTERRNVDVGVYVLQIVLNGEEEDWVPREGRKTKRVDMGDLAKALGVGRETVKRARKVAAKDKDGNLKHEAMVRRVLLSAGEVGGSRTVHQFPDPADKPMSLRAAADAINAAEAKAPARAKAKAGTDVDAEWEAEKAKREAERAAELEGDAELQAHLAEIDDAAEEPEPEPEPEVERPGLSAEEIAAIEADYRKPWPITAAHPPAVGDRVTPKRVSSSGRDFRNDLRSGRILHISPSASYATVRWDDGEIEARFPVAAYEEGAGLIPTTRRPSRRSRRPRSRSRSGPRSRRSPRRPPRSPERSGATGATSTGARRRSATPRRSRTASRSRRSPPDGTARPGPRR